MGDTSGAIISPEQERQLGEAFMREIRRSLELVDDPEANEYLQALGYRLASNADYREEFTFFLVEAPSINAFAAPGGFIGIHTGLILATESESELASVLAHEIAHVAQRHLPRAFEQASNLSLPTAAALIAALILGQNNSTITEAALATTLAGTQQSRINFTRGNEKEADRIGMQLLAASDFDPRGMPDFFERLQQAYRFYENSLPEFLSTHPVTLSRISDSRNRADQYPAPKHNTQSYYPYLRAKLRVLSGSSAQDSINYFKAAFNKGTQEEQSVARYGYALALLKGDKLVEARDQIVSLLNNDRERIPFLLAYANVEIAAKNYSAAIAALEDTLSLYPRHHPLTMLYGEALIKDGQQAKAKQVLQEQLRFKKTDPALYQLYARAAGETGFHAEAHHALAEYYYLIGETSTAIQQLQLARDSIKGEDFYLTARIDARLQDLKSEMSQIPR